MASDKEILNRIRQAAGLDMTSSSDFETLAQAIRDKTGDSLGVNTLKRLFGFKTKRLEPRQSTMDIIARFLGKPNYKSLVRELGNDADTSMFTPVDGIEVQNLKEGDLVRITYNPDRVFCLKYLGDFHFIVNEVNGSQNIKKGDILTITQILTGHRFVAAHVVRDNEDLGGYESAKENGVKSVEIITPAPLK